MDTSLFLHQVRASDVFPQCWKIGLYVTYQNSQICTVSSGLEWKRQRENKNESSRCALWAFALVCSGWCPSVCLAWCFPACLISFVHVRPSPHTSLSLLCQVRPTAFHQCCRCCWATKTCSAGLRRILCGRASISSWIRSKTVTGLQSWEPSSKGRTSWCTGATEPQVSLELLMPSCSYPVV